MLGVGGHPNSLSPLLPQSQHIVVFCVLSEVKITLLNQKQLLTDIQFGGLCTPFGQKTNQI